MATFHPTSRSNKPLTYNRDMGIKFLLSTDAVSTSLQIGMGLNMNINRIIFL